MSNSLQGKTSSLTKVVFFLDEDWHGYQTESLWAERMSVSQCQLRNTPFYAKGVSFEDVIFVREDNGELVFESVSLASGHSTYRIIIKQELQEDVFQQYWQPLKNLGCTFESAEGHFRLLAVDVLPEADIYNVYALLEKGEEDGIWEFEEGHCGHTLKQ